MTTDSTSNKPRRRFFQFSLRTLLVLLTLFCVVGGWKMNQLRRQWNAVEWVQENGGTAGYEFDFDGVVGSYDFGMCFG